MRIWTYSELLAKVKNDLDLNQEAFVTTQEYLDLFNEAVDEAESEIHRIYEDYFLKKDTLSLVSGTAEYAYPTDIYGAKIRGVIYNNSSLRYPIKRYKNLQKFEDIAEDQYYANNSQFYRWFSQNPDVTTGYQMVIVPTPQESGAFVTRWYIRNAAKFTAGGAERLDIPEFANFTMEYVKAKIRAKKNAGAMPADAAALVQQQRKQMVDTLTEMTPDSDTYIPADLSAFQEHT